MPERLKIIRELEWVFDFNIQEEDSKMAEPVLILPDTHTPCAFAEKVNFHLGKLYWCGFNLKCDSQEKYGNKLYCGREFNG